jgi:ribonuclease P protein subunit POP4
MKVTPTFVQGELIGLKARVIKSTNQSNIGIKGMVIDETRNTVTLRHANEDKVIAKNTVVLHLTTADGTIVEVDGSIISGRPEDRVKKHSKRRW